MTDFIFVNATLTNSHLVFSNTFVVKRMKRKIM